ncbi:hypothetical protein [Streptomyces colonosanans]|uniref:hypothetical protein n=1 Tax=Streptomyces colonosanans TaxID=1428652 RepID=UPI00115FE83F|nr:hypothetical protein [Streptomyces colonosanans]
MLRRPAGEPLHLSSPLRTVRAERVTFVRELTAIDRVLHEHARDIGGLAHPMGAPAVAADLSSRPCKTLGRETLAERLAHGLSADRPEAVL